MPRVVAVAADFAMEVIRGRERSCSQKIYCRLSAEERARLDDLVRAGSAPRSC